MGPMNALLKWPKSVLWFPCARSSWPLIAIHPGSHPAAQPGAGVHRGAQKHTGTYRSMREHTDRACSKHHQAAGPEPSGCCRSLILLLPARPHSPGTAAPQHCSQDHKAHCSKPETFLISVINVRVPSWPGFWLTFTSRDVNNKNDSTRG